MESRKINAIVKSMLEGKSYSEAVDDLDINDVKDMNPREMGKGPDFNQLNQALVDVNKSMKHLQVVEPKDRVKIATIFGDIAVASIDALIFFIKRYSTSNNNQKSNLIRAQNLIVSALDDINQSVPEGLDLSAKGKVTEEDDEDALPAEGEEVIQNSEEDASEGSKEEIDAGEQDGLRKVTKDIVAKALEFYFKYNKEENSDEEKLEASPEDSSEEEAADVPEEAADDAVEDSDVLDLNQDEKTENNIEDTILNQLSTAVEPANKVRTEEREAEVLTRTSGKVPKKFDDFAVDSIHESKSGNMDVLKRISEGKF